MGLTGNLTANYSDLSEVRVPIITFLIYRLLTRQSIISEAIKNKYGNWNTKDQKYLWKFYIQPPNE